jgi:ribonucleotide reductase beta subunit family protein with ferritin-like domain
MENLPVRIFHRSLHLALDYHHLSQHHARVLPASTRGHPDAPVSDPSPCFAVLKKSWAVITMDQANGIVDPILSPSTSRFTTFPIRYPDLWALYKKAIGSFWTVEEIDLGSDLKDWDKLTTDEQHFIKMVLAFFASSDGIVFENLDFNFVRDVQIPEARSFYAYQGFNESIHGETYSLMIDKLVRDPDEKAGLFRAIETSPAVKRKAEWAMRWMDPRASFAQRLIAFACVEGIFFSGSFCAIFWLKKRGLMPGLSFSNELISRDEGLHQEFAVTLYYHLLEKCPPEIIREIVADALRVEREFIIDALPCKLIGMDAQEMQKYIEFVADRLLVQLGVEPLFGSQNPFDWMETISLEGKTNFFEKRVGDYSKHLVTEGDSIRFDEDF